MNKSEMVRAIGSKTEMTNSSAERALNAVIETLTEALSAGDKVKLVDFGSFEVRTRFRPHGAQSPHGRKNRNWRGKDSDF